MTNFEKIKQMSVEEFADFLGQISYRCEGASCKKCPLIKVSLCTSKYIKEWLESEVEAK